MHIRREAISRAVAERKTELTTSKKEKRAAKDHKPKVFNSRSYTLALPPNSSKMILKTGKVDSKQPQQRAPRTGTLFDKTFDASSGW